MIDVRRRTTLGRSSHDWLEARHHFSFGNYHHPGREAWGCVRAWNEDVIQPKSGFPMHPHRDMEIVTLVRSGVLTHEDSLGNSGRTSAGSIQVMSAGSGIRHTELNLESEPLSLAQIWIEPDRSDEDPRWSRAQGLGPQDRTLWTTLVSGRGQPGALEIRADAEVLTGRILQGEELVYETRRRRRLYLVVIEGEGEINGRPLSSGDGVAIRSETRITLRALSAALEVLMTDTA